MEDDSEHLLKDHHPRFHQKYETRHHCNKNVYYCMIVLFGLFSVVFGFIFIPSYHFKKSNSEFVSTQQSTQTLKIYQYPLSTFNISSTYHECSQSNYAPNIHGWQEMYAIEYWLTNKIMLQSKERAQEYIIPLSYQQDYMTSSQDLKVEFTRDPNHADFYVVPQIITCLTHTLMTTKKINFEEAAIIATNEHFIPILDHIQYKLPYWNATQYPGENHVFVFSWDKGACIVRQALQRIKYSIKLQGHGQDISNPQYKVSDWDRPCYDPKTTIVIPQVSWKIPNSLLIDSIQMNYILTTHKVPIDYPIQKRPVLLFMRGTIKVKDDPINLYSNGVRRKLAEISQNLSHSDSDQKTLIVTSDLSEHYNSELTQTKIGICARGWAPWTGRLQAVMNSETIPVFFADEIVLPFENLINWRLFSMKINESNVNYETIDKVKTLSIDYLSEKQKQLWIHSQYFSWHGDIRFNAFAMLMRELYNIKTNHIRKSSFEKIAFTEYL